MMVCGCQGSTRRPLDAHTGEIVPPHDLCSPRDLAGESTASRDGHCKPEEGGCGFPGFEFA